MEKFGDLESGESWRNDSSSFGVGQESTERVKRVRIRVSHACDRCKRRKIRCTGNQPCSFCAREATRCIYTVPNKRGRKSRTGNSDNQEVSSSNNSRMAIPQEPKARTEEESSHSASGTYLDDFEVNGTSIERSPLPESPDAITDQEGRYVGPASGLSFLARVQKRLHNSHPTSSTFTFGDAPMAEYDPVPSIMISPEESSRLVKTFFEFTIPIDRIIHRQTIEEWLEHFQQTLGAMRDVENAPAQRAILWMIFAMAQEHKTEAEAETTEDRSVRYFLAADYQISKERGFVGLSSVQARLFQCFWLLSRSRVNHCWSLFGTVARLALALGLHRRHPSSQAKCSNCIDSDCSRRTFWSAYCLDTHLSLTLGRPKIFHDDDIDQELPSGIDDLSVHRDILAPAKSLEYSTMIAPVAYYRLHRILTNILRELYSIRAVSVEDQCTLAAKYTALLQLWCAELPAFLQLGPAGRTPLIPIFHRQRDVLHYTYSHAVILANRPLLLRGFSKQHRNSSRDELDKYRVIVNDGVKECLGAAMNVVNRVCQMFQDGMMFRSFWGACYYGFSAAAVLFVYTIQQASLPADVYQQYLNSATRFENHLATFATDNALVARYALVLQELQLEALNQIQCHSSPSGCSMTASQMDAMALQYADILGVRMPLSTTVDEGLVHAPADIATWLELESLIIPSFAGHDPLLRY